MTTHEDIYWNSFLPIFFDRMGCIMRKDMTTLLTPYGITSAHSIYLIALYLQDGQTMVGLSRFLDLDPANTNRVIKVLKEKGLVYDDRKTETSKKYSIYLTEEGKMLADFIMNSTTELTNGYFANISREKIIELRNTLIKILQNMDPELDKYLKSEFDNPYYTYLHSFPAQDIGFTMIPRRFVENKNYTYGRGEKALNARVKK